MKQTNLQQIELAFPKNMMSSSRSEFNMPTNFAKYVKNMIIHYSGAGSKRNGFTKLDFYLPDGEQVIKLLHFPSLTGSFQTLAITYAGNIYRQELNNAFELIYSGLAENSVISSAMFANKLIICNGIDNMLTYDGQDISVIKQFISQDKFSHTKASDSSIKTDSFEENFPVGRLVKVDLADGTSVESKVVSVQDSLDDGFIIINLEDAVISTDIDNIYYQLIAPSFARVYAFHDRLWAIGNEPFNINKFSNNTDKSRVYYTDIANNENSWYDDEGNLSSINIADKMPESEELVAMAIKDNMTIFFCRNYSQVWTGTNPRASGDFSWAKTIPVGLIHPNLIIDMPNDIGFFSQFGARTFSRLLQTEQLDVGDMGSEIATDIHNAVEKIRLSNSINDIHSFKYHKQGWFGFKLAEDVMIFQARSGVLSWSRFDGIFKDATAFLNTPDGNLYAAVGNYLYKYDDKTYADNSLPIHTVWSTAWFSPNSSKAWANKYTEIILEPSALKTATLQRYKNYNSASYTDKQINLKSLPDYFDTSFWDSANYDSNDKDKAIVRDKFIANNLSFSLQTNDKLGPLTIYSVRFYGSKEK